MMEVPAADAPAAVAVDPAAAAGEVPAADAPAADAVNPAATALKKSCLEWLAVGITVLGMTLKTRHGFCHFSCFASSLTKHMAVEIGYHYSVSTYGRRNLLYLHCAVAYLFKQCSTSIFVIVSYINTKVPCCLAGRSTAFVGR